MTKQAQRQWLSRANMLHFGSRSDLVGRLHRPQSARSRMSSTCTQDGNSLSDKIAYSAPRIKPDGRFVRARRLQIGELAVDKARRHKMSFARCNPCCRGRLVDFEINEQDAAVMAPEPIAINTL